MASISAQLFYYQLPLRRSLKVGRVSLDKREGLLLQLQDDVGCVGWGDIAPLPGFSRETLNEAAKAASAWLEGLSGGDAVDVDALPPSVRFATDAAQASLQAARLGKPLSGVLTAQPAERVAVNVLLSEVDSTEARRLVGAGHRAIKVKVGRKNLKDEVLALNALAEQLPEQIEVRLDANRAWTLEEAFEFFAQLKLPQLEYVEEPLSDMNGLFALADRFDVPVALDESLLEFSPLALEAFPYVKAIVIKPTLLGSFFRMRAWVDAAEKQGVKTVFSACYESGVGTWIIGQLAAAWGGDMACGLDTYSCFESDVLQPMLEWDMGALLTQHAFNDVLVVDESMLKGSV